MKCDLFAKTEKMKIKIHECFIHFDGVFRLLDESKIKESHKKKKPEAALTVFYFCEGLVFNFFKLFINCDCCK